MIDRVDSEQGEPVDLFEVRPVASPVPIPRPRWLRRSLSPWNAESAEHIPAEALLELPGGNVRLPPERGTCKATGGGEGG
jgi:hypothetical protein